ncbi:unnamed protein product [Rotaria sordida]|uniref:Uncharacterized protein n=1 Tax=Rotaria sordida TaxID=392033 RepID=A0A818VVQ8_9BILA|nr:unnamed protein product [Rotaria sordida]
MNPNQSQQPPGPGVPLQSLDLDELENLFGPRATLPSLSDIYTTRINALQATNTNLREENNRLETYATEVNNKNHDLTVKVLELETQNLRVAFGAEILKQLLENNDLKEPTSQIKSNLTKFKLSNRDVEKPPKEHNEDQHMNNNITKEQACSTNSKIDLKFDRLYGRVAYDELCRFRVFIICVAQLYSAWLVMIITADRWV